MKNGFLYTAFVSALVALFLPAGQWLMLLFSIMALLIWVDERWLEILDHKWGSK